MANTAHPDNQQPKAYCVAVKDDEWIELSEALDRLGIAHDVFGHDETWSVMKMYLPPRKVRHNYTQAMMAVGVFE